MRHNLILLLYGFTVIAALIGTYIFISYNSAKSTDFTTEEGQIKGVLAISKNEYGEDVGLKLEMKERSTEYILAGKLLEISNTEIYKLKEGDAIRVWVKSEEAQNLLDKSIGAISPIWGIQRLSDELILLSLEDAIDQRKGIQYLIFAFFSVLTASVFSFFFYRKVKYHKR